MTARRRRRPAARAVAGWVGLAAVLTFLGGRGGLALAVAIVLWDLLVAPPPRVLLLASLLAFLVLPVTVLARGLPTRATLSPEFAAGSLVPHLVAGTGLALLVLGTLRAVRASLPPPEPPPALEPSAPDGPRAIEGPEQR